MFQVNGSMSTKSTSAPQYSAQLALATKLRIPKMFGSYEELLDCAEIDAVYIPLPNHLHVPWSIKALEAGKHVLCEKPIALSAPEAQKLLDSSKKHPNLKIMDFIDMILSSG